MSPDDLQAVLRSLYEVVRELHRHALERTGDPRLDRAHDQLVIAAAILEGREVPRR